MKLEFEIEIPDHLISADIERTTNHALITWVQMKAVYQFWELMRNDGVLPFTERVVPRSYYQTNLTDKSTGIKSGLTSLLNPGDTKMTHDHFLPPQTVGEFILDNPDPYLTDFKIFKKIYIACSYTHYITKEQNELLSQRKHEVPRIYSYRDLDINLFDIETKEQVDNIIGPMIDTGNFMNDFCKWEKKMIICSDSQYGEPLPENIEFAKKINLDRKFSFKPNASLEEFYYET